MFFSDWATILRRGIIVVSAVFVSSSGLAKAAGESPSLDVNPATIESRSVTSEAPIDFQVRLKAGDQDLSNVTLSSFSNDGVTVLIDGKDSASSVSQLPCGAEQVWKLRLVPARDDALPAAPMSVVVVAAFKQGKTNPRQRYLYQTVKITPPAATDAPSLDINPPEVDGRTVAAAEPIYVQVRLKAAHHDLADVTLSAFSNDRIAATVEGGPSAASVNRVSAGAEHAWKLRLVPDKDAVLAPAALSVNVAVAFREGEEVVRQRFLFQTVKIAAPAAASVPALADIEVKAPLEAIEHERPGQLFVIVTNKHSEALHLTNLQVKAPYFLKRKQNRYELKDPAVWDIGLGEAKVYSFTMTPDEQIVPGKYSVVVAASFKSQDGISGTVTKAQDVELAVLGESDALSKLGIPSLLFLPGVLFLLSWQLLWSSQSDEEREAYSVKPTTGAFWLIAVVLSMISALAYPFVMRHLGHPRDYLAAYGLLDYIYLFAGTIAAATVFFILWRFAQWSIARVRDLLVFLSTPNENDLPIDILRKLGRARQTIVLPRANRAAAQAERAVVLEPWRQPAVLWITPPAQLVVQGQPPEAALNLVQQIATGQITDACTLFRRLKRGIRKGWWTLEWGAVGPITGPRKVGNYTVLDERASLIETP